MKIDLILGTAGHIDHGKTTLIRSLTGTDTDRLPEEKRRGITIELGFAELDLGDYRLGIVDVPGHERFVRQMLAGATGIDLALLVVAADDSVKPQTREHLDVLRLLDIQAGVIALTKVDMADSGWIDLVEDEVRELVRGTFLERAPIVRTSAVTGQGMDELRGALHAAAAAAHERSAQRLKAPFRMAIDRSFTVAGHGTVVTGSVATGSVQVGDSLLLEPGEIEVRVRGLHNHDRPVERVQRGQRAAINLAGVRHEQIVRGHELAARGHLQPSRLLTVYLDVLPETPRPLKRRERIRFHAGTAEVLATLVPLGCDQLEPGKSGFAQLHLQSPVVTTWNQPFVLRTESPVATVAGGHVMVPAARKLRRPNAETLQDLAALRADEPTTRAAAAVYFRRAALGPSQPIGSLGRCRRAGRRVAAVDLE
ncbi:MAG: selenocysteine-specific translation elongation factor [Planctomycetales bacterium]|nr:selenocysteine-specific translation elongation factor [Planctomycetales bacterium]